jgi:hypothetical protein
VEAGLAPGILEGLAHFGTNVVQRRPDLIALRTESDAVIPAIVCWLVQQGVQIHAVQPRRKIAGGGLSRRNGRGRATRLGMRDVMTVAHLTLVEACRRRVVLAGAVCAVTFLVVFSVAIWFAYREMAADRSVSFIERQGTLMAIMLVGFMAANFLAVMFAILLPVDTLSGEIDSGVMQTLASKPIDRAHIVLGKWAGHLLLALAYLLLVSAGILLAMRSVAGFVPVGVWPALPLLMLEITLSLTVAVAGGARLSTVTNGSRHSDFMGWRSSAAGSNRSARLAASPR